MADAAADDVLHQAGLDSDDVDLLVNVGVYRERGLGEPALAALIQEDIGANLGHPPIGGHGTFSFDLDNGACGMLTAAHVVRGFLESHAAFWGLVVASDSGPGPVHAARMPYDETGGALLLSWDDDVPGLVAHGAATFPEFEGLAQGYWSWQPRGRGDGAEAAGRNLLMVREKPGYHERVVDCAVDVARDFLAEQRVRPAEVDLLIATSAPGFADAVADRLDMGPARVQHVGEDLQRAHTAAPAAGVAAAMRQGRWAESRTILLVSAGAGISVAVSLYRH